MALYDDFNLDITTGNEQDVTTKGFTDDCPTAMKCYTTGPDTCKCTTDTCGGAQGRPCDR